LKESTIAISSVNYAIRAKEIAGQAGIPTRIVRLSREQTQKGCGYGLSVSADRTRVLTALLRKEGVPFSDVIV